MFEPFFSFILTRTEKVGSAIVYTDLVRFWCVLYEERMFKPVVSLVMTDREDRTDITYPVY